VGGSDELVWSSAATPIHLPPRRDPKFMLRGPELRSEEKLLLELAVRDRPGIVECLTRLFKTGLPITEHDCEAVIGFNIDSSLWASVATDIGAAGFVLSPRVRRCGDLLHNCAASVLPRLENGVRTALRTELDIPEEDLLTGPRVLTIEDGPELALFSERVLGECRFGVCATEAEAAHKFAIVLSQFTALLGGKGIAVAYIFAPTRWTDHRPRSWHSDAAAEGAQYDRRYSSARWMRVGFALPQDDRCRSEVIDAAYRIALSADVGFAFHDSEFTRSVSADADLMAHQFVHIIPPPGSLEDAAALGGEAGYEGVLAVGTGRTGLVSDVLRDALSRCPGLKLFGCSMGVLCGHTVLQLVVGEGEGEPVRLASDRAMCSPTPARMFPTSGPRSSSREGRIHNQELFWIAWLCVDKVGVLNCITRTVATVMEEARAVLPESIGEQIDDARANIVYEISRVIDNELVCAGKLKVALRKPLAHRLWGEGPIEDSAFGADLRRRVSAAVSELSGGTGPLLPALRRHRESTPVIVSYGEPGAEPWAALPILAGGAFRPE
jgi:hypothetical protein